MAARSPGSATDSSNPYNRERDSSVVSWADWLSSSGVPGAESTAPGSGELWDSYASYLRDSFNPAKNEGYFGARPDWSDPWHVQLAAEYNLTPGAWNKQRIQLENQATRERSLKSNFFPAGPLTKAIDAKRKEREAQEAEAKKAQAAPQSGQELLNALLGALRGGQAGGGWGGPQPIAPVMNENLNAGERAALMAGEGLNAGERNAMLYGGYRPSLTQQTLGTGGQVGALLNALMSALGGGR